MEDGCRVTRTFVGLNPTRGAASFDRLFRTCLSAIAMPTYEFRCPAGHDFEQFYSKISDSKSELPCPQCGAIATRRISGGAGLLFKGSGFYITDYGKDGKKADRAAAESAKKSESGGDGKGAATESKPASAESKPSTKEPAAPAKAEPSAKPSGESKGSGGST